MTVREVAGVYCADVRAVEKLLTEIAKIQEQRTKNKDF